jgi:hypothetical protein
MSWKGRCRALGCSGRWRLSPPALFVEIERSAGKLMAARGMKELPKALRINIAGGKGRVPGGGVAGRSEAAREARPQ